MSKSILVIGGTRFIGRLLVQRLVQAGHRVTIATRGYAPDPFGERIARVRVDRRNEAAMRNAFAHACFDVVFDQMCYSPLDAAIAVRTFAGRTGRYVMTSTIDVYRSLGSSSGGAALREPDLAVEAQPIDVHYPWHDPRLATACYVAGKVQAEAYLVRDGSLPLAVPRLAHVLAGPEDFTGRLAHYVELARAGATLGYARRDAAQSFMSAHAAADFLAWAGMQDFTGAVNAASDGPLSAAELFERVGAVLGTPVSLRACPAPGDADRLSPFDLPGPMVMDTARATALGYRFDHCDDWLEDTIRQHDLAFV